MSIVPYDQLRVVYHDTRARVMVVHNDRSNTVELVHHAEWNDSHCPTCGAQMKFRLEYEDYEYFDEDGKRKYPRNYEYPAAMTYDLNYFKLLDNLAFKEEKVSGFPKELFNQGYFKRFFTKVAPGILGSGAHAQVFKVAHVLQGIQLGVFAVKRINVCAHVHSLDKVLTEVLILHELSAHPGNNHLVRYNHVWMETGRLDEDGAFIVGTDDCQANVPYVYILQQYCGGGHLEALIALFDVSAAEAVRAERARRRAKRGSPDAEKGDTSGKVWLLDLEIWSFFRDVATAAAYLHAHGILHRDLKPSNCLLETPYVPDAPPSVLVLDFGEGQFIGQAHDRRRGNTGTPEFTDPRLWVNGPSGYVHEYTYECDIYSLGMILCYLCAGKLPYMASPNPVLAREEIMQWHDTLTAAAFHEWFNQNCKGGRLFGDLIFTMIKGPRPLAADVVEVMDTLKDLMIETSDPPDILDSENELEVATSQRRLQLENEKAHASKSSSRRLTRPGSLSRSRTLYICYYLMLIGWLEVYELQGLRLAVVGCLTFTSLVPIPHEPALLVVLTAVLLFSLQSVALSY